MVAVKGEWKASRSGRVTPGTHWIRAGLEYEAGEWILLPPNVQR
jgi:hypothetical protein